MPEPRMCGVQWASQDLPYDPTWKCENPATHVAIPMDCIDNQIRYFFTVCERCKDLCKELPQWGFVEIPEKYKTRR